MAQVNSCPGQNQALGNVAVAAGAVQTGSSATRAVATATAVAYSQTEPGSPSDPAVRPKRS